MTSMGFSHSWLLLTVLVVPAVLALRWLPKFRERGQVILPTYEWMPAFAESSGKIGRLAIGLRMGAILCMVPIAAGIQPGRIVQTQMKQPDALVIVLDISSSMTARDFAPENRLEAAKRELSAFSFAHTQLELGLILMAASPRLVVPITAAGQAIPQALQDVQPAGFGEDGTAIGSGIASAINRLRDGPWNGRRILLITDGVNNRGALAPADAARLAAGMGIRIDTVGMGTDGISRFWMPTADGAPVEIQARIQIDDKALEEVSAIASGSYHRVRNTEELKRALSSLPPELPEVAAARAVLQDSAWIRWLALLAIVLICLELVIMRFTAPVLPD
jgi:Ca-activated chloride channel family protein